MGQIADKEKRRLMAEDGKIRVGSLVVVGTKSGTFTAEVRKIAKKDITIRPITKRLR